LLELRLLGEMQVRLDGAEVSVASGRQRLLLARLALAEGRFVPASQLIAEIWEDRPPDSATNALQVYVSGLRKLLGPPAIRTSGRAYALDDAAAVDVTLFREELSAGLRAGGAVAASDWLDRGLSRWAGLPCSDLDEVSFVSTARAGLTDLYLSGVEIRAALRIGQGAAAQVLPELRALAREHPFREGIHAQLVLALAASGRQVEALAVFDNVRDQLAEEFGVDPGQALRGAQTAVLRSELPAALPAVADQSASAARHNLPAALTSFVGRQPETAEVAGSLAMTRLVTMTGPGGCGKTRLALNVAEAVLDRYRDGTWLIELSASADPDGLVRAVALALGVRDGLAGESRDQLIGQLRDRDLLLVLDNCEHLVGACAEFAARALAGCPGIRILATSRTPLGVPGEVEWPVPPLPVPDARRAPPQGQLGEYPSVRLFVDRAGAVVPGFALTESNAGAIATVCRRLEGIPLAIELAAARTRLLSVTQIAARLDEQLTLLSDAARHGPARQRTLREAMDWSYDLLTGREQGLFAVLSVFAGSFGIEAAEEMAGDDGLDVFSRLVIHSLVAVERDEGSVRYRLLEPLRQYAAEQLARRGETELARARHAAYYLRLAQAAEEHLDGGAEQAEWFRLLEREQDNLRVALRELTSRDDMPGVARLVSALWRFFLVQSEVGEGRRLLDGALDDPAVDGLLRARALRSCGVFAHELCDYEHAASRYAESLALFRSAGAQRDAAGVLANLGLLAANQSQFEHAMQLMQESLQVRRAVGDVQGIALSLDNLGMLALDQGDLSGARSFLEESLVMFRRGNDLMGESVAINNLSQVAVRQGDMDAAVELYRRGLELDRELANQWSTAYCLQGLAEIAVSRSQLSDAAGLLGAAAMLREQAGEALLPPPDEAEHRKLLAVVQAGLGAAEFDEACSSGRARAAADPVAYGLEYVSR
jgi:predicted ATPase/DNA-binding SARP family transcriptional activator/Tfp pilus assembly protein PilF